MSTVKDLRSCLSRVVCVVLSSMLVYLFPVKELVRKCESYHYSDLELKILSSNYKIHSVSWVAKNSCWLIWAYVLKDSIEF